MGVKTMIEIGNEELAMASEKFIKEFTELVKDGKYIELKEEILKFNATCEEMIEESEKEEIVYVASLHLSELNDVQLFILPESIENMKLSPVMSINFSYPVAREIIKRQGWGK
jgi:hypothetical protein